jgi:hypothetical protein
MTSLVAILTAATCGDGCWHAREEICRCSCGGANHGILTRADGKQPNRTRKVKGELFELVAVVGGVHWSEVNAQLYAERGRVAAERFPDVDQFAYGEWRERPTYPILDAKIQPGQQNWPEVRAVPNACRLVWARPAGSDYARKSDRRSVA